MNKLNDTELDVQIQETFEFAQEAVQGNTDKLLEKFKGLLREYINRNKSDLEKKH